MPGSGFEIQGPAGRVQGLEGSFGVRIGGSSSTCEFTPITGQLVRVRRLLSSWPVAFPGGRFPPVGNILQPQDGARTAPEAQIMSLSHTHTHNHTHTHTNTHTLSISLSLSLSLTHTHTHTNRWTISSCGRHHPTARWCQHRAQSPRSPLQLPRHSHTASTRERPGP